MSSESPSAWLEFPSGERVFLAEQLTTIGRAPGNRLIITTERVSRNHAVIRRESDGAFLLVDLGSSNGTFLNGQRVTGSVGLRNGCVVEIGLQKMTFRTPPGAAAAPAASHVTTSDCWLLAMSSAHLGCRTPSEDMGDKTFESWSERASRVIAKYRGRAIRGRDEGILAYWPIEGADSRAATVVAAVRSLRLAPRPDEELRLALHCGVVNRKSAPEGEQAPTGPEVIFALQLDRLASAMKVNVLLSEPARARLDGVVPVRRLLEQELAGYRGTGQFFTLAD